MPGRMNKPISFSPGLFQRQIKGFAGPSSVCGTLPYSGLNGPLWEKQRFRMGRHERGWTGSESETNTHWREQRSSVSPPTGPPFRWRHIAEIHAAKSTSYGEENPKSRGMSFGPSRFFFGDSPTLFILFLIWRKFGHWGAYVFMRGAVFDWMGVMYPSQRESKSLHSGPWVALKADRYPRPLHVVL